MGAPHTTPAPPPLDPPSSPLGATSSRALDELVAVMLETSNVELFLTDVARIAARTSSRGDAAVSCGITLRRDGRPLTVASSDATAMAVDEAQYGRGAGPCLQAMETAELVSVPDLTEEDRWGDYVAHAMSYGIASSLSVPLSADGVSVGAMNLYAGVPHRFDAPADVAEATALAAQASAMLTVLLRQARQAELSVQLREALSSRSTIDQAIGILMAQQRCTASAAFDLLRSASQHRNRKLRDVAADVIVTTSGQPPEPAPFDDRNRPAPLPPTPGAA